MNDFFDGSFKKKKVVNFNPSKSKANEPTNLRNYKEKIAQQKLERVNQVRSAEAAAKIVSAYKMFRVRRNLKFEALQARDQNANHQFSAVSRVLLGADSAPQIRDLLTAGKTPTTSLNYFSVLLSIQNSTDATFITQNSTRLLRLHQQATPSQKAQMMMAAARISESWFATSKPNLDLELLPWSLVKKFKNENDQDENLDQDQVQELECKRKVLKHLILAKIENLEALRPYIDGHVNLCDVNEVITGLKTNLFCQRKPSLYQRPTKKSIFENILSETVDVEVD